MSHVDPPKESPEPQYDERTAKTKRTQTVEMRSVKRQTMVQWALLAPCAGFATWGLIQLARVGDVEAKSTGNHDQIVMLQSQVTTVDAGARAAVERMEKKLDDNKADTDRKLDEMRHQQAVDRAAILDAIKKK